MLLFSILQLFLLGLFFLSVWFEVLLVIKLGIWSRCKIHNWVRHDEILSAEGSCSSFNGFDVVRVE